MRELTQEELALVAGGAGTGTLETAWWQDAFDWLHDTLSWMDTLIPGWLGNYLGGFADVAQSASSTGDLIWDRASGYNSYVIDQQTNGEAAIPFNEWAAEN